MKVCNKCKISKPLTEYAKFKMSKDGLRYYCKSCTSEYAMKRYREVNNIVTKYCIECGSICGSHGKTLRCKECATNKRREQSRAYYDENKDDLNYRSRVKLYQKTYGKRNTRKHREKKVLAKAVKREQLINKYNQKIREIFDEEM